MRYLTDEMVSYLKKRVEISRGDVGLIPITIGGNDLNKSELVKLATDTCLYVRLNNELTDEEDILLFDRILKFLISLSLPKVVVEEGNKVSAITYIKGWWKNVGM